jgi:hypothetical protein
VHPTCGAPQAALDQKMKTMGQFSAVDFNEKLLSQLKLKDG